MSKRDGGPAYPAIIFDPEDGELSRYPGMTLRDYFAGQALAAVLPHTDQDGAAKVAYAIADAMLAERAKP